MILKKNNGFTLIEVIVSIALISMIAVILSGFIASSLKARSVSQERLQISSISTGYLNEIKSLQKDFAALEDLEAMLQNKGFTKEAAYFSKEESNNIIIKIYINQNLNLPGLFEIKISGSSNNVSEMSISTVIKGASQL